MPKRKPSSAAHWSNCFDFERTEPYASQCLPPQTPVASGCGTPGFGEPCPSAWDRLLGYNSLEAQAGDLKPWRRLAKRMCGARLRRTPPVSRLIACDAPQFDL